MSETSPPKVALFVTCLVELYRPSVASAARRLLERAGCVVVVPRGQTCCGQPPYNSGDREGARAVARATIRAFEGFDHVVAPSGSCAAMLHRHYPGLFDADDPWAARAAALAGKTRELTSFLAGVLRVEGPLAPQDAGRVTCHDSCSGLRELGIKAAPRRLLGEIVEMDEAERCCGFGGLFSVKYDAIAAGIGAKKLDEAEAVGADTLVAGDLGCLLHLAAIARREDRKVRCRHIAEVLAGDIDGPAIGDPR